MSFQRINLKTLTVINHIFWICSTMKKARFTKSYLAKKSFFLLTFESVRRAWNYPEDFNLTCISLIALEFCKSHNLTDFWQCQIKSKSWATKHAQFPFLLKKSHNVKNKTHWIVNTLNCKQELIEWVRWKMPKATTCRYARRCTPRSINYIF